MTPLPSGLSSRADRRLGSSRPTRPSQPARDPRRRVSWALVAVAGAAAGLRLYLMHRSGGLHGVAEYDDGVHYGVSALLLHGVLPYRNTVFLQPPGIAVALVPFALVGRVAGDATGLATARVVTCLVGGVTTWLVGRVATRRYGRRAGLVAAAVYATAAVSLVAESTVMLEPYVDLLTVAGLDRLSRVDEAGESTPPARLTATAGALLGVAVSLKTWTAVTVLVVLVWLVIVRRDLVRRFVAGVAAAALVVCAPFFAAAPGRMIAQVVVTQLTRPTGGIGPVADRLADLAGARLPLPGPVNAVVTLTVVVAVVLLAATVRACRRDSFGRLAVALLGASLGMFALAPVFFTHYGDFLVPFAALTAGASVGGAPAPRPAPARRSAPPARAAHVRAGAVFVLLAAVGTQQVASAVTRAAPSTVALSSLRHALPRTGCVMTETASLAVLAGTLTRGTCPVWLDPRGTALDALPARLAPGFYPDGFRRLPRWQSAWLAWAARADALVVIGDPCRHPVWTSRVCHDIETHFRLAAVVGSHGGQPPLTVQVWSRR